MNNEAKLEALSKRVQRYYWPEEDEYGNSLQQPTPDDDGQWVKTDEVAGLLANLAAEKARADAAEKERDALRKLLMKADQELDAMTELDCPEFVRRDEKLSHAITEALAIKLDAQEGEG